jgi:hypothetical protein
MGFNSAFKGLYYVACFWLNLSTSRLTLNLLTTTIVALPSNANKWQMGFNLAFNGLNYFYVYLLIHTRHYITFAVSYAAGQLYRQTDRKESKSRCRRHWTVQYINWGRLRLKCDGTRAETRFRLSAKRTSPFKSAGASVQATTGSRGVHNSGSNAGYTMFRGSVESTDYPLHLPGSLSFSLPCVIVCPFISTGFYHNQATKWTVAATSRWQHSRSPGHTKEKKLKLVLLHRWEENLSWGS